MSVCRCNVLMLDRVTMSDSPVVNGAENTAISPGPKVVVSSWPLLTWPGPALWIFIGATTNSVGSGLGMGRLNEALLYLSQSYTDSLSLSLSLQSQVTPISPHLPHVARCLDWTPGSLIPCYFLHKIGRDILKCSQSSEQWLCATLTLPSSELRKKLISTFCCHFLLAGRDWPSLA